MWLLGIELKLAGLSSKQFYQPSHLKCLHLKRLRLFSFRNEVLPESVAPGDGLSQNTWLFIVSLSETFSVWKLGQEF